jgi:hypothetical protein
MHEYETTRPNETLPGGLRRLEGKKAKSSCGAM